MVGSFEAFFWRLARTCHISYFYFYKTIKRSGFYKIKIRYVFRSAYLRNGIDKLFGYQSYLSAILAVRLTTHRLGVISLALLPIVWRNKIHTALPLGD